MPDADPQPTPPADPNKPLTAADIETIRREAIEQARKEERDKLYSQIRGSDERFQAMQQQVETLTAAEAARQKEADRLAREAQKAKDKAAEAELSAKDLVARRDGEWEAKLAQMKAEQDARMTEIARQQEVQNAMWEKEREMAALTIYIRDRVEAERDNIAPELLDFIDGETKEQVDASIERVKAKTAAIVEGMRQAQQAARAGMPGVAPSGGATALTPGIDTGDKQLDAAAIKGMGMKEFAALRSQMGMGSGSGQGIFG